MEKTISLELMLFWPQAWIFALTGSLLAVISAVLTGYVVSRKDEQRKDVEAEMTHLERKIAFQLERLNSSGLRFDFAQVLRLITRLALTCGRATDDYLQSIVGRAVSALDAMNSAATEKMSSQQQINDWTALAQRAERGDPVAVHELDQIYDGMAKSLENSNHQLNTRKDELRSLKLRLELSAERARYIGVALQIVGLITVLLKDLPKA